MVDASSTEEHSLAKSAREEASGASYAEILIAAAAKGDVSSVEKLLERGADHLYQVGRTRCSPRVVRHVIICFSAFLSLHISICTTLSSTIAL